MLGGPLSVPSVESTGAVRRLAGALVVAALCVDAALLTHSATSVGAAPVASVHEAVTRPAAAAAPPVRRAAPAPRKAWVSASAATVWLHRQRVRGVDTLVLAAQPKIRRWIRAQSVAKRSRFDERILTQAVRGEQVHVLRSVSGWSVVRVDEQRGSGFPHGIIGWVPTAQLTFTLPT